ncbi:MAG: hypothetical protein OEY52_06905 [Gammaproteobacteria bacterium]|nr:hypothetical protein [Gammaproteobacteria bacterium]
MKRSIVALIATCLSLGMMLTSFNAQAAKKSFADKKVVLQISDPNPFKQTLVLNVANNLIKHYGPDQVDVEIVAFGPGLRLLFAENSNKGRVNSLVSNGVRFSACKNTIKNMAKKLGSDPELNQHAVKVDAGVVRIIDLVKQGYTLVKP